MGQRAVECLVAGIVSWSRGVGVDATARRGGYKFLVAFIFALPSLALVAVSRLVAVVDPLVLLFDIVSSWQAMDGSQTLPVQKTRHARALAIV